ncbi:MAG: hypothetical protein LBI39_04395 [Puniceicoccales bacterium]|nr:hypothetical protein [Puniceicoccales bacterium]
MALSFDVSTGHSSEHAINGSKCGKGKEELSFSVLNDFARGAIRLGADVRLMDGARGSNKVAPRISYIVGADGLYTLDFGYRSYFYFRTDCRSRANELYATARVGGDLFLECAMSYCFEERDFNGSLSTSLAADLLIFDASSAISVRSSISVGYDHCARPGGAANFFSAIAPGCKPGFLFYGWGGDMALRRSHGTYSYVGVRWAGNAASKGNWNNSMGGRRSLLWLVAGTEITF